MQKKMPIITIILTALVTLSGSIISKSYENVHVVCMDSDPDTVDWESLTNGYCDHMGRWVPGVITVDTTYMRAPDNSLGSFTWYSEGMIEHQAEFHNIDFEEMGYVGGIAMISCSHMFDTVWLKPDFLDEWFGPYVVVDCAQRIHTYVHVVQMHSISELNWELAVEWGLVAFRDDGTIDTDNTLWRIDDVEVSISEEYSDTPPTGYERPLFTYRDWWIENARFAKDGRYDITFSEIWEMNPDPRGDS